MSAVLGKDRLTSDMVREVRLDLFETLEEIGSATGLLRESCDDFDHHSTLGATMCANDALEIVARMETRMSEIAARLAAWIEFAEQEGGGA